MLCPLSKVGAWCGLCYANRRARANYKGHWGYRAPQWRRCFNAMALYRREVVRDSGRVSDLPAVCDLAERFPSLWEFLTATAWPDTDPPSPRQPGTLSIFCEDGWVKVFLNDKAQSLQHCVTAASLSGALLQANEAVESDQTPWRKSFIKAAGRGRT